MSKLIIESKEERPVSVELTITYEDGTTETRRDHDERIEIEAHEIQTITINGNVYGSVRTGGDVSCGDVDGDVKANSDVNCENVEGDVRSGADVHCQDVDGNVRAGADIQCGDVSGNASAGADMDCNYVAGSAKAGGEIASMGFEEDEE